MPEIPTYQNIHASDGRQGHMAGIRPTARTDDTMAQIGIRQRIGLRSLLRRASPAIHDPCSIMVRRRQTLVKSEYCRPASLPTTWPARASRIHAPTGSSALRAASAAVVAPLAGRPPWTRRTSGLRAVPSCWMHEEHGAGAAASAVAVEDAAFLADALAVWPRASVRSGSQNLTDRSVKSEGYLVNG